MKYFIEHYFSYGWDIINEDDPTYYATAEEAQAEIDDLIDMTREAFEQGDMEDAYDPFDFRIGKV